MDEERVAQKAKEHSKSAGEVPARWGLLLLSEAEPWLLQAHLDLHTSGAWTEIESVHKQQVLTPVLEKNKTKILLEHSHQEISFREVVSAVVKCVDSGNIHLVWGCLCLLLDRYVTWGNLYLSVPWFYYL